ncbi:glycoside hydrolase family 3 N-terminal domain-containing protein [Cryobacterium roopkundense]|uniref:glycoside hydrolase family 3 N-terminal domain-containing protein n=1 Tax=Cryobacterium roopkundense TaxID=1001240 RepID=UPI000A067F46|nr:glycoside hydrolase family 3 N-terminal domain-containing protein [Cryobacterium roopkundense]
MTRDPAALRLVNGVLWPGFTGRTVPDWLARALDRGLAGVVYFGHNIDEADAHQPARLSAAIRGIRPNALIGIDEEGGTVTRLEALRGSRFASHAQLGRLDDLGATRRTGRMIGAQAATAGATVVLAPVADVNTNPANPVIGVRSFGADTALVSRHVAAMVHGLADAGIAACVKHFPGHGDTHTDSHLALPRLNLSWAEVQRDHLPPFVAAVEAGVRAVMTAHIVLPHFGELPATLNPRVLGLLREVGFEGAIVTDALDMAAIRSTFGAGPGAVRALLAGADLLCIGNPSNLGPNQGRTTDQQDYLAVRDALLAALDDGTITVAALEAAGARNAELARPGPGPAATATATQRMLRRPPS